MIYELGDNLIPIAAITFTFLFFTLWIIAATIDSIYKTRCNAKLKERLIERGASASEITRIINAGNGSPEKDPDVNPQYVTPMPPLKPAQRA